MRTRFRLGGDVLQEKGEERETPATPEESAPSDADTGTAAGDAAQASSLEARLQAAETEATSHREAWLRAEAELANYRKRAARDLEEAELRARDRVLAEVLSLADDLERALDAAEQEERTGPIYQGVHLVHGRIREILRAHGVEVIDPTGKPFDPFEAEALFEVASEEVEPGSVVTVIEKGYRQGERLLRPARVTVARAAGAGEGKKESS